MKWFWDANEKYGRLFIVAASLLIWGALFWSFKVNGYVETWEFWRVPAEALPFSDFRLIPGSAETFRQGIEPTQRNPGDPYHRIFNYPAFWRLFFYTNITQADTVWIVVVMLGLFFVSIFLFPHRLTVLGALGWLLVIFSPAAMLLYERGNVDLIVFFICALAILALEYSASLATLALIVAIFVKVYPFFGIAVFWRESQPRFLKLSAVSVVVLILYMLKTNESMLASWSLTMRGKDISYGSNVWFLHYPQVLSDYPDFKTIIPMALALMVILAGGVWGIMRSGQTLTPSTRNLAAFRMGASIYVGTFLLGNNWDYRLAFLIFVMPQLMEWLHRGASGRDWAMTILAIVLVLASCWHFVFWYAPTLAYARELLFQVDELVNWLLLAVFSYLLAFSAPTWFKNFFRLSALQTRSVK